jgi:hypothetical protein
MSRILRCWSGLAKRVRCRDCRKPIDLRTTDQGKTIPVNATAVPTDRIRDDDGRHWSIFSWSDVHRCANKSKPTEPAEPAARANTRPPQGELF